MQEHSSVTMKRIIFVLLTALISPFIINCFFAYPQTDDFMYSHIARDMGFLKSQYHWYTTWTGRFMSTALLSVNPLVYNSLVGYKLAIALLIIAQLVSIYLLSDVLTKKTLSWQENLIFSLALLFAFLDQMDDIRSGLYWMAGVITYQVAMTLMILYFTLTLFINQDHKNDNLLFKSVVILIALLIGGTNEIVSVLVLLITAFITIYNYTVKKIISRFQIATIIVVTISTCLGLLAPGNFARLHEYGERRNLFISACDALTSSLSSLEVWITSPLTMILMCMIFVIVIGKPHLKMMFGCFNIVSSVCIFLLMIFICFFIPYWSTGMPPQNRVLNMIYLLFLIGWMINLAIIFAHFEETILKQIKKIPIKTGCVVGALYLFILFSLGTSNFILVTKDLLSGASFRYNAEMQVRESQIINSDSDICSLKNITNTPRSLFFFFIDHDGDYWVNRCYASYFGKKRITLIK